MDNLFVTLAVSALAPLMFNAEGNVAQLSTVQKTAVVQEVVEPKEEVKKEEAPAPKKPKTITYKVEEGDNLSSIAKKHRMNWMRLWQKNTQLKNQDQLKVGEKLKIPRKNEVLSERPPVSPPEAPRSDSRPQVAEHTTPAPREAPRASQNAPKPIKASQPVQKANRPNVGEPNGYGVGWCTWWVKEKRPDIGGYWGDAGYNWISAAQSAGFSTGSLPRAGAIGVTAGHVVYVESVAGDKVNISEMGWMYTPGVLNYRTVPANSFTYIY